MVLHLAPSHMSKQIHAGKVEHGAAFALGSFAVTSDDRHQEQVNQYFVKAKILRVIVYHRNIGDITRTVIGN